MVNGEWRVDLVTENLKTDKECLVIVPFVVVQEISTHNDRFCDAYNRYLNRQTEKDGKQILHDLQLIGTDLVNAINKLEEDFLSKRLKIAAPTRDSAAVAALKLSIDQIRAKFTGRYLNYTQLAMQFAQPVPAMTQEVISYKVQRLYEMRELVQQIIELAAFINPGFNTQLVQ